MILNYRINKENFKQYFVMIRKPNIFKLSKLYCDKKLLLIIDKKLSKIQNIYLRFKKCGLK